MKYYQDERSRRDHVDLKNIYSVFKKVYKYISSSILTLSFVGCNTEAKYNL